MNKRGELTSKQLITIIILIISFAIIIIFFVSLNLRQTIDTEACRNSVILRGSLPLGADTVQLKCKTQSVCLSMGEDCDVTREDLVTIDVENENELTKEMVNLLWDCWWMMGEGKVDYMSAGLGRSEPYCSICSKVYFDGKIQEKYKKDGGIPYSLIYNYMQRNKVPERDESFLFSIYKVNSMDSIRQDLLVDSGYDIYSYKLDPEKEQVVTTAIVKEGWAEGLVSGISVAVGVAGVALAPFTFGGSLSLTGSAIVGLVAGAGVGFTVEALDDDTSYLTPQYLEFNGDALKALDCKEYVSEG
jgi:hypothetical protein